MKRNKRDRIIKALIIFFFAQFFVNPKPVNVEHKSEDHTHTEIHYTLIRDAIINVTGSTMGLSSNDKRMLRPTMGRDYHLEDQIKLRYHSPSGPYKA